MSDFSILNLFPHNISIYKRIVEAFKKDNIVGNIQATGTGKSYVFLQLVLDNPDKKFLYIAPSLSIIEHIKNIIEVMGLQDRFKNIEFRTYQSLLNLSHQNIKELDMDYLVLDEFHHIGAPVWGSRIEEIVNTHENLKIFGMSAYTVRDRGTKYERDMTYPFGNELFSNKIASVFDLADAIKAGVLPEIKKYVTVYSDYDEALKEFEEELSKSDKQSSSYRDKERLLNILKNRIHHAKNAANVFKDNVKPDSKLIYFCPPISTPGDNDIAAIEEEVKKWVLEMGLTMDDVVFYKTTSEMSTEGKINRFYFYHDKDLDGNDASHKLRIMFAINQYNEGIHAPNVDGVIMGRGTRSDIVYYEQLGRALSVLANDPLVIDLSGNIEYIKKLEDKIRLNCKENIVPNNNGNNISRDWSKFSFNIETYNEDILKIVEECRSVIGANFYYKLELARNFYNKFHHLNIPVKFYTNDGITYSEDGIHLGEWIRTLRTKLPSDDKKALLDDIGMVWSNIDYSDEWNKKYELACNYYYFYGDLEVPGRFITNDGIHFDENGISLGTWIKTQRAAFHNKGGHKITPDHIKMLNRIGMRWEKIDKFNLWLQKYKFAESYYNEYGDLEIPTSYDCGGGFDLHIWVKNQRANQANLSAKQKSLLDDIGMRWENLDPNAIWNIRVQECMIYKSIYGDLEVPFLYRTKDNSPLGFWIKNQRIAYANGTLDQDKVDVLTNLGMRWENIDPLVEWNRKMEAARNYLNKYKNLEVPKGYLTIDGKTRVSSDSEIKCPQAFNLYGWIKYQKERSVSGNLSDNERAALLDLGIKLQEPGIKK